MLDKISGMGILIGEDGVPVLNKLSDDERELLLRRITKRKEKPLVLTKQIIEVLVSKAKVTDRFTKNKTFSIQDMILGYNERYRLLQGLISKKMESLVSISNCSGRCCIIGMVKDKKDGKAVLEDPTGSISVVGLDKILMDDVVGVIGERRGNDFFAEKMIFPDIPLKDMSFAPCELLVSEGISIDGENIELNNGYIEIMGVCILVADINLEDVMKKLRITEEEACLELLKRRHLLNPPDDVMNTVPDVFVLRTKGYFVKNYKGTIIIGAPAGKRIKVELESREVEG